MLRNDYYTTSELAGMLGVSRVTVFNMIKDGRLHAERVGKNYLVPKTALGINADTTEDRKQKISDAVKKTIKEYGEALKLLANE
jgi:excisionase family DNA binding protein